MKADIDRLMQEQALDALLVFGPADHNPNMAYFTGLVHVSEAYLLKKQNEAPVLFCNPMEREEAAATGLQTKNLAEYKLIKLIEQAGGDLIEAHADLLQRMFEEFGVSGRVAVYGKVELGPYFLALRRLESRLPSFEVAVEQPNASTLIRARMTKDPEEVERIRRMGTITTTIFSNVATFLTAHQAKDGVLVSQNGEALTVGDVKRRINLWLSMEGAENPEGTIFAPGRDAGIPHSVGEDQQPIPIGKPIVFDLFTTEQGGGYFYDCTRTWCLGHAPDAVYKIYEDVQAVYQKVLAAIEPHTPCRNYQILTCELFQEQGHPTVLEDNTTQKGYVHSLGHGVGLAVHESPRFSFLESNEDQILPASVFAVEPGLYYPEQEMGVRIEDTYYMNPDGKLERLADYPTDLVLKVPGT